MAKGTLKIHSENILPIIKKWLYSDKDIFVRELVSNATDAIQKLILLRDQGLASFEETDFRIDLKLDTEKKTLTISDNGIGMSAYEVENYIAQIAFSGAEEFVKTYLKESETTDEFIGHFGLGFYSAFMVSSLVEIQTKSYQSEEKSAFWSCDGSSSYDLVEGSREVRGTDIILHISDEEYLDPAKLDTILRTYCSFLPHPIYLDGERINPVEPLWLKKSSEIEDQEYIDFYHTLYPNEPDPIFWIHLNVDHPFHLKGILYFPKITPRFDFQASHIKLFSNRVFVTDNCKDLFPEFLTVLRGAIDSSDIPLNVSRSYLQMDSTVRKLSAHIIKKIADRLSFLHAEEKERFLSYWPDIETIIKLGILHDEKFYEKASAFLSWKAIDNSWTTLEEYLAKHKEEYKGKVFYTTHDSNDSHFLDLYKEKQIEVLYGGGPLDTAIFNHLEHRLSCQFQRIDGGIDDVIIDKEREETTLAPAIASQLQALLGLDNVEVEAKSLSSDTIAAFVVIDERSRRLRDYLSMTQKELPKELLGKQTLVVNTNSKLVHSILSLQTKDEELSKALVKQLYNLSLLSQKEIHPDATISLVNDTCSVLEKLSLLASATPEHR